MRRVPGEGGRVTEEEFVALQLIGDFEQASTRYINRPGTQSEARYLKVVNALFRLMVGRNMEPNDVRAWWLL